MMKPVLVFGAGQVAKNAAECFERDAQGEVAAFAVDPEFQETDTLMERPVLAIDEAMARFSPSRVRGFVAMGYHHHAGMALERVKDFETRGYELASYVSPRASIAPSAKIGRHCFIMDFNTIQSGAVLGDHVFLMPQNNIGHDSNIGEACFLAGHVCVSGAVTVGRGCVFGVNSATSDNIEIGADCRLGPGAIIMTSLPDGAKLIARPARHLP